MRYMPIKEYQYVVIYRISGNVELYYELCENDHSVNDVLRYLPNDIEYELFARYINQ